REVALLAEPARNLDKDLPVAAGVSRWSHGGVDLDDAPLDSGAGALVLLVQRSSQDDVGVLRALGEEEVDDRVGLEPIEGRAGEVRVRQRPRRVEADRQQALDLARVDRVHDLLRGDALAGDLVDVAAPDRGDVGAVLGVADVAVARQLVALVTLLAPALAV